MLRPEEAWEILERLIEPLPVERTARREALGRRLAKPLRATVDVPPADVSAMDGYALAPPAPPVPTWPVVGTIAAGDPPGFRLPAGSAVRIMTGAPAPETADRVVPVELTDGGRQSVSIRGEIRSGAHIRRRAEVVARGEPLLERGTLLTPAALGLVATHGYSEVTTYARPTVAFLTTGDEIVPPDVEPAPGQLRDSHTDFLLAAGRTLDLEITSLGIAPDEPQRLAELVGSGLGYDVLLIGGGVSMGEFDFVEDVLAELGCEIAFDHVAIQPGKPLVVARHSGGLVFGLPGNPASVMTCFWLFVRPTLRRLQGLEDRFWGGALRGELIGNLPGAKDRDRFLPAEVTFDDGSIHVRPIVPVGSHDLTASAQGTALVRVRADAQPTAAGDPCEILPLANWIGA